MEDADRDAFALSMARLFAIYKDELTPNLLDAWWGALQGYSLAEAQEAMTAHALDEDRGRYRPVPADMMRHLKTTIPAARRARIIARRDAYRAEARPVEERIYRLQADVRIGLAQAQEATCEIRQLQGELEAMRARYRVRPEGARRIDQPEPQRLFATNDLVGES